MTLNRLYSKIPAGILKATVKLLCASTCLVFVLTPAKASLDDCSTMKNLCTGSINLCRIDSFAQCNGFPSDAAETQWQQTCLAGPDEGYLTIGQDGLETCQSFQ